MRGSADSLRKEVIWFSTLSLLLAGALDVLQLRFPRLSLHETLFPSCACHRVRVELSHPYGRLLSSLIF